MSNVHLKFWRKFLSLFFGFDMLLSKLCLVLLLFYQKTFSPDHSLMGQGQPTCGCKFHPTCSQYAILVLIEKGFLLGMPYILFRLLRCHPWSQGGVDFPKHSPKVPTV